MSRSYDELSELATFEERFRYLSLKGVVGESTFGFDRWVNQQFYQSPQWRRIRDYVIHRDEGCDLGILGHEIHDRLYIHHMNPMSLRDITEGDPRILDLNNLITCTHNTHNAIHYGDESKLAKPLVDRMAGDTKLW
jgi:hypothetical protein